MDGISPQDVQWLSMGACGCLVMVLGEKHLCASEHRQLLTPVGPLLHELDPSTGKRELKAAWCPAVLMQMLNQSCMWVSRMTLDLHC